MSYLILKDLIKSIQALTCDAVTKGNGYLLI